MVKKKNLSDDFKSFFVEPLSLPISKLIKMDPARREKMDRNMARVGISETPELFYANNIVISLWVAATSIFGIIVGVKFLALISLVLAVWLFFSNVDNVKKQIKDLNEAIKHDLPKFVMMYDHARGDNIQLVEIVEKYRQAACPEFHYDLDLLIMDLKTDNEENALLSFSDRVGIPQLTNFVNILLGGIKGDDMRISLQLMEKEMKVLTNETKRRIIEELPDKVKVSTYATGLMLVLIMLTPIIMDAARQLSNF